MFEHPEFYDGSEDISDSTCKQYGKYVYFVTKWLRAGWDFHKTQSDDFRTQTILQDMDEEDRRDYMVGGVLFTGLPRQERIIYSLYYAEGISIPELADMFRTTTDQIEKIANRIREALQTEELHLRLIHNFVKHELRIAHHSYVGSLKLAMHLFPDHPNVKALKDAGANLADKLPVFGESLSAQLPHVIDGVAETVKAGAQQVSQVVDTVANGHVVETVAAGTGALLATLSKSFSAILMAFAMPFLWIMSVLLCWKIQGTALVREAASLSLRRWLTKHLFISYCGMLALPLIIIFFAFIFSYFIKLKGDQYIPVIGIISLLYSVSGIAYIVWLNRKHKLMVNLEKADIFLLEIPFEPITKLINYGIGVMSVLIYGTFILFLIETVIPGIRQSINESQWDKFWFLCINTTIWGGVILCVSRSFTLLFQYCLTISKNEESAKITPLPLDSVKGSWKHDVIRELVHIWPFVLLTLWPSILHILLTRTRIIPACIEILILCIWWGVVLFHNSKNSENRWPYILGSLALQVIAMYVVRVFVYG